MWTCLVCTFAENLDDYLQCSICYAVKPIHKDSAVKKRPLTDEGKLSLNQLDRQAMERERLERMNYGASRQGEPIKRLKVSNDTLQYPDGKVLFTSVPGHPTQFTFDDILQKNALQKALLSTFQLDRTWLLSKLPKQLEKLVLILDRGNDSTIPTVLPQSEKELHIYPPKTRGCMHMKLFILWYSDSLRIVITSANLVSYDWDTLENVVYIQDFKRATGGLNTSEFHTDLTRMLTDCQVPETVLARLKEFDFTTAKGHLIASIPRAPRDSYYGLAGLSHILKTRFNMLDNCNTLYALTSSLGVLRQNWLDRIKTITMGPHRSQAFKSGQIHVIFPTVNTVQQSILGPDAAGTITFSKKYWNRNFPKKSMSDYVPKRNGSLSHSKILLCLLPDHDIVGKDDDCVGWYYCGSHNFTQSAWGSFEDGVVSNISNYELGIMLPVLKKDAKHVLEAWIPWECIQPYQPTDEPWVSKK